MSVTTLVPSRAKASDGSRIAPRKSARAARYSRTLPFCLSSVKCVVTRARIPPGAQGVERFGEEIIMERKSRALVLEFQIGKRRVPDDGVDTFVG